MTFKVSMKSMIYMKRLKKFLYRKSGIFLRVINHV